MSDSKSKTAEGRSLKDIPDCVPEDLFYDWERVMSHLWHYLGKRFPDQIKNPPNSILLGFWCIKGFFINNKYIRIDVSHKDVDMLEVRYRDNVEAIKECVLAVITDDDGQLITNNE